MSSYIKDDIIYGVSLLSSPHSGQTPVDSGFELEILISKPLYATHRLLSWNLQSTEKDKN